MTVSFLNTTAEAERAEEVFFHYLGRLPFPPALMAAGLRLVGSLRNHSPEPRGEGPSALLHPGLQENRK